MKDGFKMFYMKMRFHYLWRRYEHKLFFQNRKYGNKRVSKEELHNAMIMADAETAFHPLPFNLGRKIYFYVWYIRPLLLPYGNLY